MDAFTVRQHFIPNGVPDEIMIIGAGDDEGENV